MSTISVDYDVLNQRGSPAWFTDTFANIPTPGFVGRMFISKDTFAFYRDTGSGWDLIGGPGIGTLTGSGATGQVSFFNGTQVITGSNNLFWDNTNGFLGIDNATPTAPLHINANGTNAILNGISTSNAGLVFANAGTNKWTIGNIYNAGANSFSIYNNGLTAGAISISSTTNNITINGAVDLGIYSLSAANSNFNYVSFNNTAIAAPTIAGFSSLTFIANASLLNMNIRRADGQTSSLRFPNNGLTNQYDLPSTDGTLALTSALSSYLPLTGGTLTGQLFINPANTAITGLDVASNNTSIRSDTINGFPRQLLITMGSGTLIQFTAQGYGANYGTDLAFYTATTSGVNASPGIYITGSNNRVGIKTGTPSYDLDVSGSGRYTSTLLVTGAATFQSSVTATTNFISTVTTDTPSVGTTIANNATYNYLGNSGYWGIRTSATGFNFAIDTYNSGTPKNVFNITQVGNVLINQTSDNGSKLQVNGIISSTQLAVLNAGVLYLYNDTNANYWYQRTLAASGNNLRFNYNGTDKGEINNATGVYVALSDINVKKDFEQSTIGLNAILSLKPTLFRMKSEDNTEKHLGFIAQEVKEFIPQAYSKTGNFIGLSDRPIIAVLVKAIQELNDKLIKNNIN